MLTARATGLLLGCLLAVALSASPAAAAIQTATKSVTIGGGDTQSVDVSCAAGTIPVSAGFASSAFSFISGGIVPVASLPLAGGSRATGTNAGGSPGTLTGYAYCDTKPRKVVTRSSQFVPLPAGTQRTATASCPAGSVPISGGYRFINDSHASGSAVLSRRVHHGWEVSGYNGGPGLSVLKAFVWCQRDAAPLEGQSTKQTINPFASGTGSTPCPAGTRIVSGGFNGHLKVQSGTLRVALPFISRRAQNSWEVKAASAGTSSTLTTIAYCEPSS
jgi:hypothetical protein